jgi:putative transcriptional regulator
MVLARCRGVMQQTKPASKLVKELRYNLGMTQEQFAMELGVTISTIQRWENETSQPSPMALKLIKELSESNLKN